MVTVEDMDPCARCGAQGEVREYPHDIRPHEILYYADCISHSCTRGTFAAPKFKTPEEAVANWNETQRAEKA